VLVKGLDRLGVRQERNVIGFVESLSVLHTRRVQRGYKAVVEVVVLFVQRHPVSDSVAEMLVERGAVVVEVVDDSSRLPRPVLLDESLRNIPVVERQDWLDVVR
jgi:hypothetical protein